MRALKNFALTGFTSIAFVSSALAMGPARSQNPSNSQGASLAPAAQAVVLPGQNRAVIFGGNDQETLPSNQFQSDFIKLSTAFQKSGWDVHVLFGGNTARCKLQGNCAPDVTASWDVTPIAAAIGKNPADIPRASRAALLSELDSALAELHAGDQLLLFISDHGWGVPVAGQNYWRHGISVVADQQGGTVSWINTVANQDPAALVQYSTQFQNTVTGSEGIMYLDDADLTSRFQKIKDAKIKLAIFDDSCFSGGSIPMLSQFGCVMTSTGSKEEDITYTPSSSYGVSGDNIAFSMAELLNGSPDLLLKYSLGHANRITPDEVWMRLLPATRIEIDVPEYSSMLSEQSADDALNQWLFALDHENSDILSTSIFNDCTECSKDTPQIIQDYAKTYLEPLALSSADQAANFKILQSLWAEPGYGGDNADTSQPLTETNLLASIANLPSRWQAQVDQYQSVQKQIQTVAADLQTLNINPAYQFTGDLAGLESLFSKALAANTHSLNSWAVSPSGIWVSGQLQSTTPDDPNYKSATDITADQISQAIIIQTHSAASMNDQKAQEMSAMIQSAELQAWNSLSQADKNRMKEDFKKINDLQLNAMQVAAGIRQLTSAQIAAARMYAFLGSRSGQQNQACSNFILKQY